MIRVTMTWAATRRLHDQRNHDPGSHQEVT